MGRRGYLAVSVLAALALATPAVLFALDTGPGEQALGRGLLGVALAAGLSWLPLWPAAAATRVWGYGAGLPTALGAAALYAAAVAHLLPLAPLAAGATWLLLWWPSLAGPGAWGRPGAWLLLLGAGALARWRAPAAWAELWPWVLAFNALLNLLYSPLPAQRRGSAARHRSHVPRR